MQQLTKKLKSMQESDFEAFRTQVFNSDENQQIPIGTQVSSCGQRAKIDCMIVEDATFTSGFCVENFTITFQAMGIHAFELNQGYMINWSYSDNIDKEQVSNIIQAFKNKVDDFC